MQNGHNQYEASLQSCQLLDERVGSYNRASFRVAVQYACVMHKYSADRRKPSGALSGRQQLNFAAFSKSEAGWTSCTRYGARVMRKICSIMHVAGVSTSRVGPGVCLLWKVAWRRGLRFGSDCAIRIGNGRCVNLCSQQDTPWMNITEA